MSLVAAELDYPIADYANQIIASIKAYAEEVSQHKSEELAGAQHAYTAAPMKFRDPLMHTRFDVFIRACGDFMRKSKWKRLDVRANTGFIESHLFAEPGIYMSMLNGVALQGFKASSFAHVMIKGPAFTLEDEQTYISQEEALDWATCSRFSPLGRGFRMTPY